MKACSVCSATYPDEVAYCPRDGASLSLMPGFVIRQRFRVDARLGRGGFGEVYRVWHLFLNEPRALKILLRTRFEAEMEARALAAEARVLRQLQHPNIVKVEDVDETEEGRPFVVMEYVEGESLRNLLDRERGLPSWKAVSIGIQVCSALGEAHEKGVLHRDIKPGNILIITAPDGSPVAKVIDFGIAKVREDSSVAVSGLLTVTTGCFLGSANYCSPEQAEGMRGGDLDGRADLYSLGLVIFEALTGVLPFRTNTPDEAISARRWQQPMTLKQARPDLEFATRLSATVTRALNRDRNQRFRSAAEMSAALREALAEITPRTGEERTKPKRWTRSVGSKQLIVLAALIMIACFIVVYLSRDPWTGFPPGVYVVKTVSKGQRITRDLLKEVGPASQSVADNAPQTMSDLGVENNCLVFENPLPARQRIHWADIATCPDK
jgi:eukaryotic-like serine/threonine-protein kinase